MRSWSAVFAALLGMLVFRNRFLFWTPIHELGDTGANSIIINQAKHFELLVGNYSRQGFNHPGPGYFYIEAAGEWLFHDWLRLVPTPWNGQVLALYVLNAALFATVTLIVKHWTGSAFAAITALLAMLVMITYQPQIINNAWMPYVYVPSFLLLLVASASVIAGRAQDLWAVALAGGLLVHGHAVFLLFAPVLAGAALVSVWLRHRGLVLRTAGPDPRRRPRPVLRFARVEPVPVTLRAWLPAAGVLVVFLAPILINLGLHWPGEFGKYFGYGASNQAGSRSVGRSLGYVYWYWWPFRTIWPGVLGIPVVAAIVYAAARIREPFVRAGLWLSGVVTVLLAYYAFAGIDTTGDPYMGYFYWSVPLFVVAMLAAHAVKVAVPAAHATKMTVPAASAAKVPAARAAKRASDLLPVVPFAAIIALVALVPGFRTITNDDQPAVPSALAALSHHANGRPIVFELAEDDIGPELPGLMQWARREGLRACVRDPRWSFITTTDFICTPAEVSGGALITRWKTEPTAPARPGELTRIGFSALVAGGIPARPQG